MFGNILLNIVEINETFAATIVYTRIDSLKSTNLLFPLKRQIIILKLVQCGLREKIFRFSHSTGTWPASNAALTGSYSNSQRDFYFPTTS